MSQRRRTPGVALTLAVLVVAVTAPGTAGAEEPGLSVLVDDGVEGAVAGEELVYMITVRGPSGEDLEGVRLEQRLPQGFQAARSPGAEVDDGRIVWTVDVPAEAETTVAATVLLSRDLPLGREAGTVACAYLSGEGLPADCDSDAVELSAAPSGDSVLPWIGAAAILAAAAAAAAMGLRAIRRHPLYAGAHRRPGRSWRATIGVHRHILNLSGLRITQRR